MSRQNTGFVLAYHGCDADIGEKALGGKTNLLWSRQPYDWLGSGIYFWEADAQRALEWAEQRVVRKKAEKAFVIGAAIDLGNCLDLTQRENLSLLDVAYQDLETSMARAGKTLPQNTDPTGHADGDKLLRHLDCMVINNLHELVKRTGRGEFDTVRGLFVEGAPVYPGARIYKQTHTQIAVRNRGCIKGLFRVPEADL